MKALNVSLTTELQWYVEQNVQTGLYQTASEVVREALRLLKQQEEKQHALNKAEKSRV